MQGDEIMRHEEVINVLHQSSITQISKVLYRYEKEIGQKAKQEVINDIPDTWLDPLFNRALGKLSFTPKEVEDLFSALGKRLEEKHLHPITDKEVSK